MQFRGMGSLDLICVLICYNQEGKKLSPLYPKLNRRELLELPEGTETVKIGFRPKGSGSATIKDVLVGGADEVSDRVSFLSRSNVLVLTNHYPSGEALYRNMFVHKRVTGYREEGLLCDVLQMYPYSKDGYREFEGINVLEGKGGDLMGVLDSGAIDTVCVHFLDREMWEVLKHYLGRIRLIIWSHGADIHPWWRRTFNYQNEQQLEQAKGAVGGPDGPVAGSIFCRKGAQVHPLCLCLPVLCQRGHGGLPGPAGAGAVLGDPQPHRHGSFHL